MNDDPRRLAQRGRGAIGNRQGRYEGESRELVDDGWGSLEEAPPRRPTRLHQDRARTVLSRNESPDVPFAATVNAYRGCEHGCIYCYARPTHAWLGLSPGLDFETEIHYKPDAALRLRETLDKRGYQPEPIGLGANTDPYQPIERRTGLTRSIIEVLAEHSHPLGITTKGALVERDIDLLAPMAERNLAHVAVSLATLDTALARGLEPRASAPARRLATIRRLSDAGIPVSVLVSPVIPGLTDATLEAVLEAAREHGAMDARYSVLRLPGEVAELFSEWLESHYPERAARVLSLVRDMRGGELYRPGFDQRMTGTGPVADLVAGRFALARRRLGFRSPPPFDASAFHVPGHRRSQMDLFA